MLTVVDITTVNSQEAVILVIARLQLFYIVESFKLTLAALSG